MILDINENENDGSKSEGGELVTGMVPHHYSKWIGSSCELLIVSDQSESQPGLCFPIAPTFSMHEILATLQAPSLHPTITLFSSHTHHQCFPLFLNQLPHMSLFFFVGFLVN